MSWARTASTHSAAAVSGAIAAWVLFSETEKRRDDESAGIIGTDVPSFPHDGATVKQLRSMSPRAPITMYRPNSDLEIAFDARTRNPLYVMERLGHSRHKVDSDRPPQQARREQYRFREEKSLRPKHRSRNASYRNSGYDRGHLAPAADFGHDDGAMAATFSLCNASPQAPSFNRTPWRKLEDWVRKVAREERDEGRGGGRLTYVVTGPLWLPSKIVRFSDAERRNIKDKFQFTNYAIGSPPSLVSVPTHFFKVVAVVGDDEKSSDSSPPRLVKFAAFVLPNDEESYNKPAPLNQYLVRLTDLEAVSGISFFPALFGDETDTIDDDYAGNDANDSLRTTADILTESVWMKAGKTPKKTKNGDSNTPCALVPLGRPMTTVSKRRRQQVLDALRSKSELPFEHICSDNKKCNEVIIQTRSR
mmetsp:Transcript_4314/g.7543  ORF Transcript_4314/g.7543 Transcript_4314/m.7543 type:complete len:419 (-) Transcript_4314:4-1260(-)